MRELTALVDYALVLLDLVLPDGDGQQFLPVLRQGCPYRKSNPDVLMMEASD